MSTNLHVRLTDDDSRIIDEYCTATGLCVSDLVRRCVRLAGPALVTALGATSRAVTVAAAEAVQIPPQEVPACEP